MKEENKMRNPIRKSMRWIVSAALVAGMATTGLTTMASAADEEMVEGPEITWSFSTWGKRRPFIEGMEAISDYVEKRTDGNFKINVVYGEQLSKSRENLDGIAVGAFEMAMFCAAYHPQKHPSIMVLDLPFLPIKDLDATQAVHEAVYGTEQVQEEFARWNATIYMSNIIPQYEFMGKGDAPEKVEDFAGLRIRALGGLGKALEKVGASPTPVPASEIYTALDRGTIDATGFSHASMLAFRFHEVADWYSVDMNPGTLNCPTVINVDALNGLPENYRDLLMAAKKVGYEALKENNRTGSQKALDVFEKELEKVKFSDEEMEKFREKGADPVWQEWIAENEAKGVPAQELFDLVMKTATAN